MKLRILPLAPGLIIALVLLLSAAPNELTAAEHSAGWKLLFDGDSTAAWRAFDRDTFPERGWVAMDGTLHCIASNGRPNGGGGDVITRELFTDFEFTWEWRMSPGGNSGVKYLIAPRAAGTKAMFAGDNGKAAVGFEYQLMDDLAHPDAKHGPIRTSGALYQLVAPRGKTLRPVGEWNVSRLIVRGPHVGHWLNGKKIVETELSGPALQGAIAASKYAPVPRFGVKAPTAILLQDHGDAVWFRSLKIRPLKP